MASFREVIQDELEGRGWTKYELVKRCGVAKTTVYEYLRGNREISSDALERICEELDLVLTKEEKN